MSNQNNTSGPASAPVQCSAVVKPAIYAEHYSLMGCVCYKTDLPWTLYRKYTLVLCPVADGIAEARRIAKRALRKHMLEAINAETQNAGTQRPGDAEATNATRATPPGSLE